MRRSATRRAIRLAPLAALCVVGRPAAGQGAPDVVVRAAAGADRRLAVTTVETAAGARDFVRLDALAAAVGGTLTPHGEGARLEVGGTAFELREGVQYARVGATPVPLVAAPVRDARGLLVPTQFAVDVLPRVVRTYAYDAATRTLRPARLARSADADAPPVRLPSIAPRTRSAEARPADETTPDAARPDAVRPRRLVAIDAGHGGPDAGMRGTLPDGSPLLEKDVTLGVARALRDVLTERGVGVVMTRSTDTLIALADRGRLANTRHADLFVSVHVNAANPGWRDPRAARGFETYFLSEARTEEARQVADRENASSRFEAEPAPGADPLRFVMSDLAQNAHLRESSRLAAAVQSRLAEVHPGPNRRVHQAGFKVLVTASMPAVLVEVGFGSNRDEAAYIASARGRRELAEAIAGAVTDFLARYARGATG